VFVQKKEVLKLRYSIGYFYVSDLNTGEEMMYFRINDNETPSYFDDDYVKVFFNDSEKEFESKSHQRILMAQMINEGVFDSDWNLVEENVDKFIRKYDENISNRTVRF
jgi:hypothetical protein